MRFSSLPSARCTLNLRFPLSLCSRLPTLHHTMDRFVIRSSKQTLPVSVSGSIVSSTPNQARPGPSTTMQPTAASTKCAISSSLPVLHNDGDGDTLDDLGMEQPCQEKLQHYPSTKFGDQTRSFGGTVWFSRFPWLEYSKQADKCF
jgi:hypothetical protein